MSAPLFGGPKEGGTILYLSLTTLTTTGYGDIVAVDPFARIMANLEAVIGQFYLAITVARLVTLELEGRRRRPPPSSRRYAHASGVILNRHVTYIDDDLAKFE
jgi:hypothetical protein